MLKDGSVLSQFGVLGDEILILVRLILPVLVRVMVNVAVPLSAIVWVAGETSMAMPGLLTMTSAVSESVMGSRSTVLPVAVAVFVKLSVTLFCSHEYVVDSLAANCVRF